MPEVKVAVTVTAPELPAPIFTGPLFDNEYSNETAVPVELVVAAASGSPPTLIVAATVFVLPSMTEVVFEYRLGTYTALFEESKAGSMGPNPTFRVATTMLVLPLMIETVPEPPLAT